MNKVILIGNLGGNPEKKALPSGQSVANFSLATNRTWVKDGQKQTQTEWHNVVFFGKQADTIAQYCEKGQKLVVEGRIQTRSWEGQDGEKKYKTEIIGDRFEFINTPQEKQSLAPEWEDDNKKPEDVPFPGEENHPGDLIPF